MRIWRLLLIYSTVPCPGTLPACMPMENASVAGPWAMHVVDDGSARDDDEAARGADGVRLADVNGDGRPDIVTGWEESGHIRAYLHPGPAAVRSPWPVVTVGKVGSPEDAVFVDLDGDGATDLVVTSEMAGDGLTGVYRLSYVDSPTDRIWRHHDISGPAGSKFDRVELIDLDDDGDLDVLTCEERENLGVVWYENPRFSCSR